MEYIKILGLKNYLLYKTFRYIEIVLNIPYRVLRIIIHTLYEIFDWLDDCFWKDSIITLSKISKRLNEFRIKCLNLVKESEDKQ